jgi:hypothetical protein
MTSIRLPLLGLLCAAVVSPAAALSLSLFNVASTENFDALGTAAGSALPPGWAFHESGSGANTSYAAGNGSSSTGNTYSFGATGDADRALGALRTTSLSAAFGTVITNDTSGIIAGVTIQFTGEQWRLGATGREDRLDFAYSLDGTSLTTGTWLEVDALDFLSPVTAGTTGALDGNLSDNRQIVSYTLTGLNLAPGASFWLRWSDVEASGSDDGLGIDDFAITALAGKTTPLAASVPDGLPWWTVASVLTTALAAGRRFDARRRA